MFFVAALASRRFEGAGVGARRMRVGIGRLRS